ncbi:MAG: amidohydrolase [Lachnospiraceae bacterium]|nr:amidohydrolase [Lachnospiraceae bacterium]
MNTIVKNGKLLLTCEDHFETADQDLYIAGDRIAGIGAQPEDFTADETIDASGMLIIPGLINAHTHVYMTVLRGVADDVPFEKWLFEGVMPKEEAMSSEEAYQSARIGLMEMIKSGTTCFNDMQMFIGQACRAAVELGIRGVSGRGLAGDLSEPVPGGSRRINEAFQEMQDFGKEPLLTFALAPHAPYTCSEDLMRRVPQLAAEHGLRLHIHLSESRNEVENCIKEHGMTPIAWADHCGCFDVPAVAAHCVHVTEDDIRILAEKHVSVASNPASNMKLGNGFAPIPEMLSAGINVCLGTDGAASNNRLNMFHEMSLMALIHKGNKEDPVSVSAAETLRMATINGAKALGLDAGEIAPGKLADLVFLDLSEPSLMPFNENTDPASALVYGATGAEVDSVMVGGKMILQGRKFVNH